MTNEPEQAKEQTQVSRKLPTALSRIQEYVNNPDVRERLKQMLGDRAGAFANSIINVFKNSASLQKCEPATIMSASMIAASMNLPIDPALGYAAIVPYGTTAQFQIMYKGLIQLCIRSGQYARIHNTEVYADELKRYDPITGRIEFNDQSAYKMRATKNTPDVVGYYSCFKLTSGFECENYITTAEATAHGKRFSKAYQYDLNQGKKASLWSLDPVAMGKKTSLKMLLGKYGIMSIEMQDAFVAESDDFNDNWQPNTTEESKLGAEAVKAKMVRPKGTKNKAKTVESADITLPVEIPDPEFQKRQEEQIKKLKQTRHKPGKYVCNACGVTFDELAKNGLNEEVCPDCGSDNFAETKAKPVEAGFQFVCHKCGRTFAEPKRNGKGQAQCPHCLSLDLTSDIKE